MDYLFETGTPITEEEALAQVAELGFHGLAFDEDLHEDEPLHWHEFDSIAFVISGTGSFADEHGQVTGVSPGCRLQAPAGWLHRNLAGPPYRVVLGTNLPGDQWTAPINKDPAERPASLAMLTLIVLISSAGNCWLSGLSLALATSDDRADARLAQLLWLAWPLLQAPDQVVSEACVGVEVRMLRCHRLQLLEFNGS